MPIFIDRHDVPRLTARDAAEVHAKDIEVQHIFDCSTMTYWIDEDRDNAFCLVEAPNKEAVIEMHNKAHGMVPNEIIEVDNGMIMAFLGRIQDPVSQEVSGTSELSIFCDPAFRFLLVIDIKDRDIFSHRYGAELHNKLIEKFTREVRKSIQDYKGRPVDHYDEFIASFSSVTHAVDCAVNISETSYSLGYSNPSYFTKCFKKRFNITPGDIYRDQ